jgi:branched-chain amino acid transport system substrate-binding protein
MKNKIWVILGVIIILALIGILYYKNQKSAEENIIKIGTILPLTGQISLMGQEVKNGAILASENINAVNKKKLKIIFEDSKMDPKEGVSEVNKLIDVDNVKYVYAYSTPIVTAVQPITESKKILLAGISISPKIVENKSYTLRIYYNLNQALEEFKRFIDNENYSRVAVLYQNGEALEAQVNGLEKNGVIFIDKEKFNLGDTDFRTQLTKIKLDNPELIMLLGYGTQFPTIFQQMIELGMEKTLVLGGLDFIDVPKDNLDLYSNAVFITPSFNIEDLKISNKFVSDYKSRFGKEPGYNAAYTYDNINLLYLAITNTEGSPEKTKEYITGLINYKGAVGDIEILSNGDTKSSLSLAAYKDGKVVLYNKGASK